MNSNVICELNNLTKIFNKNVWAIKKINLEIIKNSGVAIIGPNGSGKTVLGQLIGNQIDATSGSVEYDLNGDVLSSVGYQFRESTWPEGFKVKDITLMFKNIYNINDEEWYQHLIETFEIQSIWNKNLVKCPVTVLQLFSLFLALLPKPELIVIDELSNSIGLDIKLKIVNFLKECKEKLNFTFIICSPDKLLFDNLCDRIIVLDKGVIIRDDVVKEIISKKTFDEYSIEVIQDITDKKIIQKPDPVFKPILKHYQYESNKVEMLITKLISVAEGKDEFLKNILNNIIFYSKELENAILFLSTNTLERKSIDDVNNKIKKLETAIKIVNKKFHKINKNSEIYNEFYKFKKILRQFQIYLKKILSPIFKKNKVVIDGNELTAELSKDEFKKLKQLKKKYINEEIKIIKAISKVKITKENKGVTNES